MLEEFDFAFRPLIQIHRLNLRYVGTKLAMLSYKPSKAMVREVNSGRKLIIFKRNYHMRVIHR